MTKIKPTNEVTMTKIKLVDLETLSCPDCNSDVSFKIFTNKGIIVNILCTDCETMYTVVED